MMRHLIKQGLAIVCFSLLNMTLFAADNMPGFAFTEHKGQLADPDGKVLNDILYYGRGGNLGIYFTANKLMFVEREDYKIVTDESTKAREEGNLALASEMETRSKFYRFDLVFEGSNKNPTVEPSGAQTQHSNFYYGHCPDGIKDVKTYDQLTFKDLYPGIDLVYKNDESGLKYEFVVAAGADPSLIKWHYEGLTGKQILEDGSLVIKSPLHQLTDKAPYTFTQKENKTIESSFIELDGSLTFQLGKYANSEAIVIDPTITWSTYFDAPSTTWDAISFTSTGDFFSSSYEYNSTPPFFDAGTWYDNSHNGGTDILIVKFSNEGEQLWTTFYGGSGYDYHINNTSAVDDNDNFYICGQTNSTDWPLYNPGGSTYYDGVKNSSEAFILKFDEDGNRLWSTFWGGSSGDRIRGVTTDNNNLYIVGETYSSDLPVQSYGSYYYDGTFGGGEDAFLARFSSTGAKQWCTYFGGNGYEDFVDVWIDPSNNNMYMVGEISGWSAPGVYPTLVNPGGGAYYDNSVNGGQDVLIVKLNSSRQLAWSTIYGGDKNDNINGDCGGVRTDSDGNVYVVGKTTSTNLPIYNPGGGAYYQVQANGAPTGNYDNDGFILKFNSSGVRQWATYYGGSGSEEFRKVKIDLDDNIWIGAFTNSTDVPLLTKAGSYNQSPSGTDALFVNFNQAGVRQWASCYGGSGSETCRPFGIYQTSSCGLQIFAIDYTNSTNLPLQNPGSPAYYDGIRTNTSAVYILKMEEGGGGSGPATGTITWTGAVSEDWFEPCNWDKTAVPTASNPVVIPAGTSNKPHINDNTKGNANCYTITIESGSANGGHLYLNSTAGGRLNVTKP